ncbi:MAG TPA: glycoside hydrolase family 88 protein [Paenibacillus sp.]|nr:glycoside hydrolase family 88 protein [Paenibacillus sp.]
MADVGAIVDTVAERTLQLSRKYAEAERDPVHWRWARWDWSMGVAFYGLCAAAAKRNRSDWVEEMRRWVDDRLERGASVPNVNSTALLHTLLHLDPAGEHPTYADVCRRFDRYLMHEQARTPSGAIPHALPGQGFDDQIWADTLFMSVLYLARRGAELGEERYTREAVSQLLLHMTRLRDNVSRLYTHGWDDVLGKPLGSLWGRGNAWVAISAVEILQYVPDSPDKSAILSLLQEQLEALEALQAENGMWRTVLDREGSYQETSVTVGIAFAVAKGIRLGMVDRRFEEMGHKALRAVSERIDAEGNVLEASTGTAIQSGPEGYNAIPFDVTPFTQGLTLMALCESLHAD